MARVQSRSSVAGVRARSQLSLLTTAFMAIALFVSPPARAEDPPLTGAAYTKADEAYAAFRKGDFPTAVSSAKEAVNLRPDSVQLRLLLVDALAAGGKLEEADAAATEALGRFGNNADLISRQKTIRERIAYVTRSETYTFADAALKAFAKQDYQTAVTEARKAVAGDPTNRSYRLILVNSLIAANDLDEASKQVDDAISKIGSDPELVTRQRFIAERIAARPRAEAYAAADAAYKAFAAKDYTTAANEARKAIQLDPDNHSYQVLLANIERTARAPVQVQSRGAILAQRGYSKQRRGDYSGAAVDFMAALRAGLPTRSQTRNIQLAVVDCYLAANDPQAALDTMAPFGGSSSYDVAIRLGYVMQALKRPNEAIEAFELASRGARSAKERSGALSAEISLLAQIGRKEEARARFEQALASGELQAASAADIANLALIVGDDRIASEYYGRMRASGSLKGNSLVNAGYIATRLNQTQDGIAYFKSAIDAYYAGALPLDSRQLFTLRRQIAEMSRTWGTYASATYSKAGSGPGVLFAPPAGAGKTWQVGAELYYRPFGYLNGSVFDVFVRVFETPFSELGGEGGKTTQGMYGARWKPFGQINWIVEAAQVFKIGSASRNDWLLRTAYSAGEGTDLRVDVPAWGTWQFYADYNHFVNNSENTADADLRIGYSYRLDPIDPHLVLFPHVGAFANYDNKLSTQAAYAVGGGATLRYWFREDQYTAPMSYIDLTAQYRVRIGGDERAQGWFGQVLVSY